MPLKYRSYAWSYFAALMLTIGVGAVASLPRLDNVALLLLPGALLAAILFPEGIHSDFPMTYLVVAGLIDAFILMWPVMFLWTKIGHTRRKKSGTLG